MAAVPTGMLHAGMRGAVDREESAAAMAGKESMTVDANASVTATEMTPGSNRDSMQDRSAAGTPAAVKRITTDL